MLSLLFGLLTSGCWDRLELEDQLFLVTIALDRGASAKYQVTASAAVFGSQRSGIIGGREGGAPPSEELAAEADSIAQAIYVLNSSVSRRISMRHIRSVIVGEELAKEGILDMLTEVSRNPDFRTTAGFFVARGRADEILREWHWLGEYNPARIAEGVLLVEKHLHMSPPVRLHHMINRTGAIGLQPFAPVIAVNRRVKADDGTAASPESAIAGEHERTGGNPVEVAGTALFSDNRLVGYLTVDETQAFLALRGEMGKAYITIESPFHPGEKLLMRFQQENLPKYKATFTPEGPRVAVRLVFEGEVLTGSEDYRQERVRTRVEQAARVHMEESMRSVVAKMREWRTDPVGFGLHFRGRFARWKDWDAYNWISHIDDLNVRVEAAMRIRRHGLSLGGGQSLEE